jgi:hypothetical protein
VEESQGKIKPSTTTVYWMRVWRFKTQLWSFQMSLNCSKAALNSFEAFKWALSALNSFEAFRWALTAQKLLWTVLKLSNELWLLKNCFEAFKWALSAQKLLRTVLKLSNELCLLKSFYEQLWSFQMSFANIHSHRKINHRELHRRWRVLRSQKTSITSLKALLILKSTIL